MPVHKISNHTNARCYMVDPGKLSIVAAALLLAALLPQESQAERETESGMKEGPQPLDGRKLTHKMNCKSCHIIESDGGTIGPPLDGIGKHRTLAEIERRLNKEQKAKAALPDYVSPQELMSHVRLPHVQAKAIAIYLYKLPETKLQWDVSGHNKGETDSIPPGAHFSQRNSDASSKRGKELYFDHGCAACHSIGAGGGRIGPSLQGVGARRSRSFIESRITNGALLGPSRSGEYKRMGYRMPPAEVSKQEVNDITNYLLTIPK